MVAWLKALLFVGGGVTAATGAAYVTGMLDPWFERPPAEVASLPDTQKQPEPKAGEQAPAAAVEAPQPADPETTPKQSRLSAPSFDVVRAEPDGSLLVAGKAPAGATVELLSGESVLARASADASGDFVIVLDETLPAGDYALSLRATSPENDVSLSTETAILSIPETDAGQVLVMVEEPGAPAALLSVPDAVEEAKEEQVATAAPEQAAGEPEIAATPEADAPQDEATGEPAVAEEEIAAAAEEQKPAEEAAPPPASTGNVSVEAVEIEGDAIFVAGHADTGRTVRVYANALLLGDALASEGGRFLVEARRALPVGHYVVRADLLAEDGSVLARAAVPFEREPGEAIAAVAAAPAEEPAEDEAATVPEAAPASAGEEVAAAAKPEPAEEQAAAPEAGQETAEAAAPPAAGEADVALTAPPLQRVDKSLIIRRGDNLWRISRRVYGKGVRYSAIYLANKEQISDPDKIWPGQVFTVPQETEEGEEADLDAVAGQVVEPDAPDTNR